MAEIVGIRFKDVGKVYHFDPDNTQLQIGDVVIVETAKGIEAGYTAFANREIKGGDTAPAKKIIRKATPADLKRIETNKQKEKDAYAICEKKIADHKLVMKLVNVEYTFDNSKVTFYFTADGRVDFRALVKDLAYTIKSRIELRQIGVRDKAKAIGGLGICGKPFCCSTFLNEFHPVSIKMAKEQGLSLSPVKISGTCGRLMCCLKYEQAAYTDLLKTTPKIGAIVKTPEGRGLVVSTNLLTGVLQIKLDSQDANAAPVTFNVREITLIKDGRIYIDKKELEKFKDLE
jgi:cell fate regulator YaaT (PSP1 superfamily)